MRFMRFCNEVSGIFFFDMSASLKNGLFVLIHVLCPATCLSWFSNIFIRLIIRKKSMSNAFDGQAAGNFKLHADAELPIDDWS